MPSSLGPCRIGLGLVVTLHGQNPLDEEGKEKNKLIRNYIPIPYASCTLPLLICVLPQSNVVSGVVAYPRKVLHISRRPCKSVFNNIRSHTHYLILLVFFAIMQKFVVGGVFVFAKYPPGLIFVD